MVLKVLFTAAAGRKWIKRTIGSASVARTRWSSWSSRTDQAYRWMTSSNKFNRRQRRSNASHRNKLPSVEEEEEVANTSPASSGDWNRNDPGWPPCWFSARPTCCSIWSTSARWRRPNALRRAWSSGRHPGSSGSSSACSPLLEPCYSFRRRSTRCPPYSAPTGIQWCPSIWSCWPPSVSSTSPWPPSITSSRGPGRSIRRTSRRSATVLESHSCRWGSSGTPTSRARRYARTINTNYNRLISLTLYSIMGGRGAPWPTLSGPEKTRNNFW